jgi:hypothetical protein
MPLNARKAHIAQRCSWRSSHGSFHGLPGPGQPRASPAKPSRSSGSPGWGSTWSTPRPSITSPQANSVTSPPTMPSTVPRCRPQAGGGPGGLAPRQRSRRSPPRPRARGRPPRLDHAEHDRVRSCYHAHGRGLRGCIQAGMAGSGSARPARAGERPLLTAPAAAGAGPAAMKVGRSGHGSCAGVRGAAGAHPRPCFTLVCQRRPSVRRRRSSPEARPRRRAWCRPAAGREWPQHAG